MASSRLQQMREKLKSTTTNRDNSNYPFWKIPNDSTAKVRFLPIENELFFWIERILFKWELDDPQNPGKKLNITVPSMRMYGERCEIMEELNPFWETDKAFVQPKWPKRSYLYQGFVRSSDLSEDNAPENPIRIFTINKTIHTQIKTSILQEDEDLALPCEDPVSAEEGLDFIFVKGKKSGEWPDWSSSKWANKSTSLTDDELAAIDKYGLHDLKAKLPPKPSTEAQAVMMEIFHAVCDDLPWNSDWETYFKPWRPNGGNSNSGATAEVENAGKSETETTGVASASLDKLRAKAEAPVSVEKEVTQTEAPAVVEKEVAQAEPATTSTSDVLARLRSRNK